MMDGPLINFEVTEKKVIAQDVYLFTLIAHDDLGEWRSGQYVTLMIPSPEVHLPRAYSLASHPMNSPTIEIIVKLNKEGAASDYFRGAEKGHTISGTRPGGNLTLKESSHPAVFIAAGAGVAPLLPMIIDILEVKKILRSVTLLFYRMPGDYAELEKYFLLLETTYPNFRLAIIEDEAPCTSFLPKSESAPVTEFYLCGGKNFVADMEAQLIQGGFNPEHMYYEWKGM